MTMIIPKRNHISLGRGFFSRVKVAAFPKSDIRYQNSAWAKRLGFGEMLKNDQDWVNHFAKFTPIQGSLKAPYALAYHGHQFGHYNPDLGDGRGVLYAQIEDAQSGKLLDLGTKGTGRTPYSRTADGRLTLKGAVREILATEMLDALGVNTSKTFSVIETGEQLSRNDEPSPTRSAVMVRLNHGHIRIGSFQRLAFQQNHHLLERLLRYSAETYYGGELDGNLSTSDLAIAFVRAVGVRMANLTAQWMAAGFVHGVLNTDNFNISGESFDYGPWRFLPELTPGFTAAYFDHQGRYAYGRQPEAAFWALCRLADCFVQMTSVEDMQAAVTSYQDRIPVAMVEHLCRRLGVDQDWPDAASLTEQLFTAIRGQDIKFEDVMFDWFGGGVATARALSSPRGGFYKSSQFAPALDLFMNAPTAASGRPDHPYFSDVHPQSMLVEEVEAIWAPIAADDDWSLLRAKIASIHRMSAAYGQYSIPPETNIVG